MRQFISICFVLFVISCQFDQKRSINTDKNTRAEGKINRENKFDGMVKYYDRNTNKLVEEAYFKNGIKDSTDIFYYDNGSVAVQSSVYMGEQNGNTYMYDENGNLARINYFFYGLRCGNNIDYSNKQVATYWFYSLDNSLLFHFNYDSIKGKRIGDLQPKVFFYTLGSYRTPDQKNNDSTKVQCFLYTPNPPKFDFRYSLVLVDSTHKVLSVLNVFSKNNPWTIFDIDPGIEGNINKIALKLDIRDSINNEDVVSMRILDH